LPRAVLRHLLLAHQVGLRSRVLDVGCGHGELVHYLVDLGIDAAGLDESPDNIACAKRLEPRSDFQLVMAPAEQSLEHIGNDEPLDLIVVRHLTTYDGSLFCASSFQATAKLMQHLRPGGWLVFLVHRDTGRSSVDTPHDVACFARHLSSFPGTCRVSHFADCELATIANDWLHLHRHHGEFLATSFRAPQVPMSAAAWQHLATQAAGSYGDACCSWATRAIERQAA
jgi:SAM-dependent methyltransferase